MNALGRIRHGRAVLWLGTAAVVIALSIVAGLMIAPWRLEAELPDPDLSAVEAPVADLLQRAREKVTREASSSEAWGGLGAAYHAHRLVDEASRCYETARGLDPDDFRWAYLLAIAREVAGAATEELIELFEEAARLRPDYAPIHARLGAVFSMRGRLDEAAAAYRRAIELEPGTSMAHRGLGLILLGRGEAEQALDHLVRSVELAPQDGAAYSALASAYLRLGNAELAERTAQAAAQLRPVGAIRDPLYEREVAARSVSSQRALARAVAAIRDDRFADALTDLEIAQQSRPWDPEVHYWLGLTRRKLGENALAAEHLARAVELQDDHVGAHLGLAALLETAGRLDEALAHYRRASELSPLDATIRIRLGALSIRGGEADSGLRHLEEAVRLRPEDANVRFVLAQAYHSVGDTERAIDQLERAVAIEPDHRAAARLAELRDLRQ